jgi:hypothetical protein
MKNILKNIFNTITIPILLYLSIAFVNYSIDPYCWGIGGRYIFVCIALIWAIGYQILTKINND